MAEVKIKFPALPLGNGPFITVGKTTMTKDYFEFMSFFYPKELLAEIKGRVYIYPHAKTSPGSGKISRKI